MAEFLTGNSSSALVIISSVDMFLVPGATRYVDFQEAIAESGTTYSTRLRIDGTILCADYSGIILRSNGIATDQLVIGSAGQVHVFGGTGIKMFGGGARFINDGQVSGDTGAEIGFGILSTVENRGTLTGNALNGAGLSCAGGQSFVQVNNSGTIAGYTGIKVADCYANVMNTGTIRATDGSGLALDFNLAFSSCEVRNFGTIAAPVTAYHDGGSDDLFINSGRILGDVVFSAGKDTFRGKAGVLEGILYGGAGNDRLASGYGDDEVYGGDGGDWLRGNTGDDMLFGGKGNDTLRGDAGDDTLDGGSGADTFVFVRGDGHDRITGFTNGQDQIDVSAFHFAGFANLSTLATNRPGGLMIDLGSLGGGTVFVAGMTTAQFDLADVIL
jgi:Ca2+-binding RTX toxin-like protein